MGVQLLNQGRPQAPFIILLQFFSAIIFIGTRNINLSSTVVCSLLDLYYFINILFYLNTRFGAAPVLKNSWRGFRAPSQPTTH